MNQEILSQLRDIHWPGPPHIWPFAIGYYVVFLLVIAIIVVGYYFLRVQKRRRVIREILREISLIEEGFIRDNDPAHVQGAISALLRRIVFLKNSENMSRTVDLDSVSPELMKLMPSQKKVELIIDLLKKDRFKSKPDIDGAALLMLVREQVKQCRI